MLFLESKNEGLERGMGRGEIRDGDRNMAICPSEYGRDSWLRLPQQTYLMALSLASPQLHVVFVPPCTQYPVVHVSARLIKLRAARRFLFMPAVKKQKQNC